MQDSNIKYLNMLSKEYPTKQAVCREIINLNAILNLPKGTEHFMSDLHGEYEAFLHILNNCSGVVKEKVDLAFGDTLLDKEKGDICTLIYYPREKLKWRVELLRIVIHIFILPFYIISLYLSTCMPKQSLGFTKMLHLYKELKKKL